MAGDVATIRLETHSAVNSVDALDRKVGALGNTLKQIPGVNPKALKSVEEAEKLLKKAHKEADLLDKGMGGKKGGKRPEGKEGEKILKTLQGRIAAVNKLTTSLEKLYGVQEKDLEHQKNQKKALQDQKKLAAEIGQIRKMELNQILAHEKAIKENANIDAQTKRESLRLLRARGAEIAQQMKWEKNHQKAHLLALSENRKRDAAAAKKAASDKEAAAKKVIAAEKDVIRVIKQKMNAGERLSTQEQKLVVHVKRQINAKRTLTRTERELAAALKLGAKNLELQGGALIRTGGHVGKLRTELSRARNALLVYSFALRPGIDILKKATDAAVSYERATVGLTSVGEKFGVSQDDLNESIASLTNDGLLKVHDAAKGLKNLLTTGIGLENATQLMSDFKDSASFNRQGMLDLNQAVVGATDGFKNMLSRMVDNAGITKNLTVMLKEQARAHGLNTASLSDHQKYMLLVKAIHQEAAPFLGDSAKLADTMSGRFDKLSVNLDRAYRAFGQLLDQSGAIRLFTDVVTSAADAVRELAEWLGKTREERDLLAVKGLGAEGNILGKFEIAAHRKKMDDLMANINKPRQYPPIEGYPVHVEEYAQDPDKLKNMPPLMGAQMEALERQRARLAEIQGNWLTPVQAPQGLPPQVGFDPRAEGAQRAISDLQKLKKEQETFLLLKTEETGEAEALFKLYQMQAQSIDIQISKYQKLLRLLGKDASGNSINKSGQTTLADPAQAKLFDSIRETIERRMTRTEPDRYAKRIAGEKVFVSQLLSKMSTLTPEQKVALEKDFGENLDGLLASLVGAVNQDKLKDTQKALDTAKKRMTSITDQLALGIAGTESGQFLRRKQGLLVRAEQYKADLDALPEELKKTEEWKNSSGILVDWIQATSDRIDSDQSKFVLEEAAKKLAKNMRDVLGSLDKEFSDEKTSYGIESKVSKLQNLFPKQMRDEGGQEVVQDLTKGLYPLNFRFFDESYGEKDEKSIIQQLGGAGKVEGVLDAYREKREKLQGAQEQFFVDNPNLNDDDRLKFQSEIQERSVQANSEYLDRLLLLYQEYGDKKKEASGIDDAIVGLRGMSQGFGDLAKAARFAGNSSVKNLDNIARAASMTAEALGNMSQGLKMLDMGGMTALGGFGMLVSGGAMLYEALSGPGEGEKEKSAQARKGRSGYGSTISRGPQTINVSPVLSVQAEGDVYFSEDGLEVAREKQLAQWQEAMEFNEVTVN
jgi:hypothetical protein